MLVLGFIRQRSRACWGFFWNANSFKKNEHEICIGNYRPDIIACGLQQTEERVRGPTLTRRYVQPTRHATGIRIKTSARRRRQRPKPKLPPRKRRPLRRQPRYRLLRPKLPRRHTQNRHRKPLILRPWLLPLHRINRLEGVGFVRRPYRIYDVVWPNWHSLPMLEMLGLLLIREQEREPIQCVSS